MLQMAYNWYTCIDLPCLPIPSLDFPCLDIPPHHNLPNIFAHYLSSYASYPTYFSGNFHYFHIETGYSVTVYIFSPNIMKFDISFGIFFIQSDFNPAMSAILLAHILSIIDYFPEFPQISPDFLHAQSFFEHSKSSGMKICTQT